MWARTRGAEHQDHPKYLGELASAVAALGGFDEAESLFRQALDIHRKLLPARAAEIAATLVSLGTLLQERGDPRRAEPVLREAVDIYRETLPEGDRDRTGAERALAQCETALRRQQD